MATKTLMTADEFLTYPCETPCELVCGEIMQMSPPGYWHGIVCANVTFLLKQWSRSGSEPKGIVAANDSGVVTQRDPDTVRGPDVFFLKADRVPVNFPSKGFLPVPPDLAVEIVSPGDRWSEVIAKVGEYLEAGIQEIWVINPERSQVQVFRSDCPPEAFGMNDELTSESVLPGFRCRVSDFFVEM